MCRGTSVVVCHYQRSRRANRRQPVRHPPLTSFHVAPNWPSKFAHQINPNTRWAWCNLSARHAKRLTPARVCIWLSWRWWWRCVAIKTWPGPLSQTGHLPAKQTSWKPPSWWPRWAMVTAKTLDPIHDATAWGWEEALRGGSSVFGVVYGPGLPSSELPLSSCQILSTYVSPVSCRLAHAVRT